jgi:hypothetical protein
MAVISLAKAGEINNCVRATVGLPPTGPGVAPTYTTQYPECVVSPARTAEIQNTFDTRFDDRFKFVPIFVGGSA